MAITPQGLDVLDIMQHIIQTGFDSSQTCPLISKSQWPSVSEMKLPVFYADYTSFSFDLSNNKDCVSLTFGLLYDNTPLTVGCNDPEFGCPRPSDQAYYIARLSKILKEIVAWMIDERRDPCTRKKLGTCIRLTGTSRVLVNNYANYDEYANIALRGRGADIPPFGNSVGILEAFVNICMPATNLCMNEVFPTHLPSMCAPINATQTQCIECNS
ncbi:MAG: hypothetical protein AAF378_10645 [Cyanobacteria bacterium P01_A01_bin.84]